MHPAAAEGGGTQICARVFLQFPLEGGEQQAQGPLGDPPRLRVRSCAYVQMCRGGFALQNVGESDI